MLVELLRDSGELQVQLSDQVKAAVERGDALHIPFACVEFWRTMTEPGGYAFSPDHCNSSSGERCG